MIDEIMDNFDFSKVLKTMRLLEWALMLDTGYGIPEYESSLRTLARELILECIDLSEKEREDYVHVKAGPYKVSCFRYDGDLIRICLEFVVTEWDSCLLDYDEAL